ncbi:beta-ketoacyl-ACP synthase III [Methylocystis heyeri]|uniref:Beta-ketoacyl-[acyl-carrier-protein] synthase III n=1 Tax=Methylocystis heyeri TaxID=391905 RepID=A0A6B8K9F2_9HYPH|nr:beta-ketoacyl-ACP synthase III [Methylocystis heyeri]QGM44479.1 beta-ketoacyl-ACP synthase III [Methylocystis heyeri]
MLTSVILGTGAYAPSKVLTNDDLEKMVATNGPWIVSRTGIRERRIAADGEATSDLAAEAARRAMELAGVDPAEIDLIIVCTVTGDTPTPSCAAYVQAKIGATRAFAFDVSAACAGSLYGLVIADQFIRTGAVKRALVIGAETLSRVVDWTNRETCVLFGDAAGAMLLGASEEEGRGLLSSRLRTDGSMTEILGIFGGGSRRPFSQEMLADNTHKIKMRGREVYKVATRLLPEAVQDALAQAGLNAEDVTHVIAHQANLRIIESAMETLGIPLEKCWINIDRYGNTSSASMPITLDEANRAGKLKKGDVIAMMAIGAGMTWGGAVFRW